MAPQAKIIMPYLCCVKLLSDTLIAPGLANEAKKPSNSKTKPIASTEYEGTPGGIVFDSFHLGVIPYAYTL